MAAQTIEMVTDARALETVCERIRAADRIGIDTEFHNERTYTARLMVIQIAFEDGCAIVDPLALNALAPLVDALADTTVVGHALTSDLKIFADRFERVPNDVFDCQVAGSFLGYGMAISLADLVRDLCNVRLKKSQTVSDWSARPFSERQLEYLIDDVAHLLDMHDTLSERLHEKGRYDWAIEECRCLTEIERYQIDERRMYGRIPGANRMSRRELGILSEIVKLRDRIARERDLPLKYILADDVVGGIATLRPHRVEDLAQLRRLDAGTRRALGAQIVEAVRRGEAIAEAHLPAKFSRPLGNARETLVSLMSVAVGEIARENDLPASLLAPRASLERLAREVPATREEFERVLDLSPWRLHLLGDRLWRLLSGATAMRIEGYATGDPRIILEQ
jgi:ribonuclease D